MGNAGKMLEAIVAISGEVTPEFKSSLTLASGHINSFGKKLKSAGKAAVTVFAKGASAATKSVAKLSAAAVTNALTMEKEMSNVATLLDGSQTQVDSRIAELQKDVISLSNATGKSTSDLTDGLYQVISAVGDSEDSIGSLEAAARAARAGNATTTESINLLTAVTKGYGDTSQEAFQKASDLAFETLKLGQTSFPELAASIGQVTPLASALGMSQEELFGATATLTGVTGSTAEVMTQMKAALSGLLSPSESMSNALAQIGYSSGAAAMESLGFQGTLNALSKTVNGDNLALAKLFSSVRAQTAVLSLAGNQADNFTEKTKAMYKCTGATNDAFDAQRNNIQSTINSLKNYGQNFLTAVGVEALPVVEELANAAIPAIKENLEAIQPTVTKMVTGFCSNLLPLVNNALPAVISVIDAISPAVGEIADVSQTAVSGFCTNLLPLVDIALPQVASAIDAILPSINSIVGSSMNAVSIVISDITPIIDAVLPSIVDGLGSVAGGLSTVFGWVSDNIGVIEALAVGIGAAAAAYNLINAAIAIYNVASPICTALTTAYTGVTTGATTVTTLFGAAIKSVFSPITLIVGAISLVITVVVLLIKNFDKVKEVASNVFGTLKSLGQGLLNFFKTAATSIGGFIKAHINGVISSINGVVNKINSIKIKIPDWVPDPLGGSVFGLTIPTIPMLAKGGFTNGVSIAGEAGQEAVISFQPSVRKKNIEYWLEAGKRLGVPFPSISGLEELSEKHRKFNFEDIFNVFGNDNAGSSYVNVYEMGGVVFKPVINVYGKVDREEINSVMETQREDFFDMLDDWWSDRTGGGCFDPGY